MVAQDGISRVGNSKSDAVVSVNESSASGSRRSRSQIRNDTVDYTASHELTNLEGTSQESYLPSHEPKWHLRGQRLRQSKVIAYLETTKLKGIVNWLAGPKPPRQHIIQPIFPRVQTCLSNTAGRVPGGRIIVVVVLLLIWLATFSAILSTSTQSTDQTIHLSCISRLWFKGASCGLNGEYCQPFEGANFTFSCPSNCGKVRVLEPYTIGDLQVNYRSLVIGGPGDDNTTDAIYRGDSFICPAAIHAGLVSNGDGGCARLHRMGEQRHFPSSTRNGISSIAFQPDFPLAYSFSPADVACGGDPQWKVFAVSILITTLIALITPKAGLFFSSTFVIVFFQVGLASDSPYSPSFNSVLSLMFGRFLPAAFVAYVVYHTCLRRTLHNLKAFVEKTVLWLGGCWVGALNTYTFDRIPLRRLTGHDLQQQPGAITALVVIVLVILAAALGQFWYFRQEGRLFKMLTFYIIVGATLGVLAAIPLFELRIHHYILALLLLPGTSLQTRPSLLYQGLLVGLFINGIARWGFASIVETADAIRGDGQVRSLLPEVLAPTLQNLSATFTIPNISAGWDGISILVNDVERWWQSSTSSQTTFSWNRTQVDDPVFFRFAFTQGAALGGKNYGDFTKPGTWFANESWSGIAPGPSR